MTGEKEFKRALSNAFTRHVLVTRPFMHTRIWPSVHSFIHTPTFKAARPPVLTLVRFISFVPPPPLRQGRGEQVAVVYAVPGVGQRGGHPRHRRATDAVGGEGPPRASAAGLIFVF